MASTETLIGHHQSRITAMLFQVKVPKSFIADSSSFSKVTYKKSCGHTTGVAVLAQHLRKISGFGNTLKSVMEL